MESIGGCRAATRGWSAWPPAGEPGLQVDVDQLGRDTVGHLYAPLPGLLDGLLPPLPVLGIKPVGQGELLGPPVARTKP